MGMSTKIGGYYMSKNSVSMPVVALRGMTVLPKMLVHFDIKRKVTVKSIEEAMSGDQKVFLVTQKDADVDFPKQEDLHEVGTIANIKQVVKLPGNVIRVLVEGVEKGYFCTNEKGEDFVAAVWPGLVHFPDFLNKDTRKWFGEKYKILLDKGIEGFWNDMNEPAIFYTPEG